ncbi:MAG: hypothetical protein R3Y33_03805 [Clostridia bacterium]
MKNSSKNNQTQNQKTDCKQCGEKSCSCKDSQGKSAKEHSSFDNSDKPPAYDIFPTSMRIRIDPVTNAVIPSDEAVYDVKRWVDFNTK